MTNGRPDHSLDALMMMGTSSGSTSGGSFMPVMKASPPPQQHPGVTRWEGVYSGGEGCVCHLSVLTQVIYRPLPTAAAALTR